MTVLNYLTYSTITKYEVVTQIPMEFPQVDICLLTVYDGLKLSNYITAIQRYNPSILDLKNYTYLIQSVDYLQLSIFSNLEKVWQNSTNTKNRQIANEFTLNQILISCRFQNKECTAKNFTRIHNCNYGACFSFNSVFNGPIVKSNKEGEKYGLQLELFAGDPTQQVEFGYLTGFRLIIHNQSVDPFAIRDGYNVPAGRQSSFAISRTLLDYLPLPYQDCIPKNFNDYYQNDLINFIQTVMNKTTYNQYYCQKVCTQLYAIEKCGCFDYGQKRIPYNSSLYGCYSDQDLACYEYNYNIIFENFVEECDQFCLNECDHVFFSKTFTTATYPTPWYANLLLQRNSLNDIMRYNNLNTSILSYSYLQSTLSKINVFYQEMTHTSISESPALLIEDLIAFICGNLGLFLGMSLLSIIEFIDMFVQFIFILIRNSNKMQV